MEIFKAAKFYECASDSEIDKYEAALDSDDIKTANSVVSEFFKSAHSFSPFEISAMKKPTYLELPPERGDMVFVLSSGRYARLIAISDDKRLAVVRELTGAYPVPYDKLRRVR